jgi:hypothetical protein
MRLGYDFGHVHTQFLGDDFFYFILDGHRPSYCRYLFLYSVQGVVGYRLGVAAGSIVVGIQHVSTAVGPTTGAGMVGQLGFLTFRTVHNVGPGDFLVGSALVPFGLGRFTLGYSHSKYLLTILFYYVYQ